MIGQLGIIYIVDQYEEEEKWCKQTNNGQVVNM